MKQNFQFGMIGVGTMGKNLVLNMCDHGYTVAIYDRVPEKVEALKTELDAKSVFASANLFDFVNSLQKPRNIFLLVPAGKPVDDVIDQLKPLLEKEDLIVDLGNSHYTDTNRRLQYLFAEHLHFMGVGVSGGENGARFGPSIMPGGNRECYERIAPMLEAISAKVNNQPCVSYLGPGSAGHYVKMVHNGIEYGIMQQIAEAYQLLKDTAGMSNDEMHYVFSKWNKGPLKSFLIEITSEVLARKDDGSSTYLVDVILDEAAQKGTGGWTSASALELGVPIPVIDAAVSARNISSFKMERVAASKKLAGPPNGVKNEKNKLVDLLEQALQFSFIVTYSQGMSLLQKASAEYQYNLKLNEIASLWRGGCIIRADELENIRAAFGRSPNLEALITDDVIAQQLNQLHHGARQVISAAVLAGIATPALSAALAYYDSYRTARLPANVIQGLRDYFGAHTYKRIDREGSFHTHWEEKQKG